MYLSFVCLILPLPTQFEFNERICILRDDLVVSYCIFHIPLNIRLFLRPDFAMKERWKKKIKHACV